MQSPVQQLALLELNRYVLGAYEEMADGVVDLQWQQLNKMRELCGLPPTKPAVARAASALPPAARTAFPNATSRLPPAGPVTERKHAPICISQRMPAQLPSVSAAALVCSPGATLRRMAVLRACRRWPR